MAADLLLVLPLIIVGAALYTSVGHGGATAYLAILTLAGYAIDLLVTTVLALNVLAAGLAFLMFRQAGHLRAGLLAPLLVTSIPAAYVGGAYPFTGRTQEILLAVALLAAAARLLLVAKPPAIPGLRDLPRSRRAYFVAGPVLGAVLGFLAGATGIGGGIFLSPILLALGWASVKETAGVASAFIVLNSLAGLAARLPRTPLDTDFLLPLAVVVLMGAVLGSFLGARRISPRGLEMALGIVLLVAAARALVP